MVTHHRVLDILSHAVGGPQRVVVATRDGRTFRDGVCEVYTRFGANFVIFHAHNRMMIEDITRCEPIAAHAETLA
jgi:predicted SpoU family rRNA methylase